MTDRKFHGGYSMETYFPISPLMRTAGVLGLAIIIAIMATMTAVQLVFAQDVAVTEFAPGIVSGTGDEVFRGSFSPSGDTYYFFRKVTPGKEDYRIFVTHRTGGTWSEPDQLQMADSEESEMYPTISPDGTHMVFSSYRAVMGYEGEPNANLWSAEKTATGWTKPELLRDASTFEHYDAGPSFYPDGTVHFASTSADWSTDWFRFTKPDQGGFGAWKNEQKTEDWINWRDDVHIWNIVHYPLGRFSLLNVSEISDDGRRLPTDIYVTYPDGKDWSEPQRLGSSVNTDEYENFIVIDTAAERVLFVRAFRTVHQFSISQILTN